MIKIFAQKVNWGAGIELLIGQYVGNGKLQYLFPENAVFTEVEEGKQVPASFVINVVCAQELMDNLWSCGLRPSEGSGSAGALQATQNHLKDLQKYLDILFGKLKDETK